MLFSAKVATANKRGSKLMVITAVGFFLLFFAMNMDAIKDYIIYIFLVFIAIITIVAFWGKGNSATIYDLKDNLFVYEDRFEIAFIIFPFAELKDIDFNFSSFYVRHQMNTSVKNDPNPYLMGLQNFVAFKYKKQKFEYEFLISSEAHYCQFVQMLENLYFLRVSFIERNQYGKTFLMRNVTAANYIKLKEKY